MKLLFKQFRKALSSIFSEITLRIINLYVEFAWLESEKRSLMPNFNIMLYSNNLILVNWSKMKIDHFTSKLMHFNKKKIILIFNSFNPFQTSYPLQLFTIWQQTHSNPHKKAHQKRKKIQENLIWIQIFSS